MGTLSIVPTACLCVLFCFATSSNGENVLISASVGEASHFLVGKEVGKYLAKHGHNVTVLVSNAYDYRASNPDDKELNFVIFNHSVPPEAVRERHLGYSKVALQTSTASYIYSLIMSQRQGSVDDCEDLLSRNPDVMRRLEDAKFSVVVFDQIWMCSLLLAMKLNTTAVMSNPMAISAAFSTITRNPVNLAVMPDTMFGFTNRMTFLQRVTNVYANFCVYQILAFFNSPFDDIRARHQIRPDLIGSALDLAGTYPDLFLTNVDVAADYPTAFYPNVIPIGGITASPPSPLPQDIEYCMQSAGDEGVIMFTLGSYIQEIRPDFLRPFAEAFKELPQFKVLWQLRGEPTFELPGNVKTLPWLPQNDLLGHPKMRLFIFHGGNNGFYEAQYHGVPVIVIPLSGDAIDQAARVVDKGFGVAIDKASVTKTVLIDAIKTVLGNDSYSKSAKRQSALLRSRPMHPGDRAAFWVDHLIKNGGQHMRNPSLEMNFIQRNLIDVYAFLITIALCILFLVVHLFKCLFRGCKRLCFGSKEKRD